MALLFVPFEFSNSSGPARGKCLITQVGDPVRRDLPEMRVQDLERDMAVIADASEMVEDRPELKIPLARQDSVAVASQLARRAAQVANLNPGQVMRRQVSQILEFARARVVMEGVETDSGVTGPGLRDAVPRLFPDSSKRSTSSETPGRAARRIDERARRPRPAPSRRDRSLPRAAVARNPVRG